MTMAGLVAGLALLAYLARRPAVDEITPDLKPIAFSQIAGWERDDHGEAFAAFLRSCEKITAVDKARRAAGNTGKASHPLLATCKAGLELGRDADGNVARVFFETHFTPHRYAKEEPGGFVTGYYEPELKGSRKRSDRFAVPVYGVPDDLEQLYPDEERARRNAEMTAGRKAGGEIVPYYDRREIEEGALVGRGLELLWLADAVDSFYMHIQGSGRVVLEEGGYVRLSYAAKNGHPYTAIGKHLMDIGAIEAEKMSMEAVRGWLAANPDKARELMWTNRSYIFFRELPNDADAPGPEGAQGVPLTPLRSLAVDTSIHATGTPVWLDAPGLDLHGEDGFHRLMIAQDTGSAIRGPERGDIFWGSGEAAGALAGSTRHAARFTVLLPRHAGPES